LTPDGCEGSGDGGFDCGGEGFAEFKGDAADGDDGDAGGQAAVEIGGETKEGGGVEMMGEDAGEGLCRVKWNDGDCAGSGDGGAVDEDDDVSLTDGGSVLREKLLREDDFEIWGGGLILQGLTDALADAIVAAQGVAAGEHKSTNARTSLRLCGRRH
jgi:hypothetical protein